MKDLIYSAIIKNSPIGYAYHEIILDEKGIPIDYKYLDVNKAFEELTGVTLDRLIGKKVTEVFPKTINEKYNWINLYGDIAVHGGSKEFEQYFDSIQRWYKVQVQSHKRGFFLTLFDDITNYKKLEITCKENEAKLRRLTDNITDVVFTADINFNMTYVSPSVEKLLGETAEENIKKTMFEKHPPESLEKIQSVLFEELEKEKDPNVDKNRSRIIQVQHYKADGSIIEIESHVSFMRDENGVPIGIQGVTRDITERKQFEEALKQSELRFKRLAENSPAVVYQRMVTADGKTTYPYISDTIKVISGISPEEVYQNPSIMFDRIHTDDKGYFLDLVKNSAQTLKPFHAIFKHLKNDKYIWLEVRSTPEKLKDGSVLWNGFFLDVTDRIKAEEALRESEERNRAILKAMPDFIFVFDKNGTFIDCNIPEGKNLLMSMESFIGKSIKEIFPGYVAEMVLDGIKKVFETKEAQIIQYKLQVEEKSVYVEAHMVLKSEMEVLLIERDITDRIKIEEELISKSNELEHYFSSALDLFCIADIHGNFIRVNKAWENVLGYSVTDLEKRTFIEFVHPDDVDATIQAMSKLSKQEKILNFINRYRCQDGNYRYIEWRSTPHGNQIFAAARDITDRMMAEAALRESERMFSTLVDNLPGFSYRCAYDKDWTMKYISNGCTRITGYSPDDFIDNKKITFNDIIHPYYQESLWKKWTDCLAKKEPVEVEYPIITSENEIRWVWERGQGVFDDKGNVIFLEGFITEITERKHTEKFLQDIIDKNPLSIQIVDRKGYTVKVNNAHTKLFGAIPPSDYSVFDDLQVDRQGFKDLFEIGKKGEVVYFPDIFYNVHDLDPELPDNPVWIRMLLFPLKDSYGKPQRYVLMHEDITERKRHEAELAAINEELTATSEALRENNQILKEAKDRAEESNRLKTAFLQNMSHEIRTPMNAILGFLELLKRKDLDSEQKDTYIDIVNQSGYRLLNTINDIIEISKIEARQTKMNYCEVDLNEIIQFHYDLFYHQCAKKGLQLKLISEINQDKSIIITDKGKLESIISNLINNAIKFTSKGFIEIGNYIKDDSITFYVKDTGIGIPENKIEVIFERFVQADTKTSRSYEGSGLGLTIAKAYIEMLNGKIWVQSKLGEGSSFFFSIPFTSIQYPNEVKPLQDELEQFESFSEEIKILLAEDDETSFNYFQCILADENVQLYRTSNGKETVRYFKENQDFSIILMDIKMPEMDGYEATQLIRTFNKKIPIIAQTAYALPGDREKAIESGCTDYITKPISRAELLALIQKFATKIE